MFSDDSEGMTPEQIVAKYQNLQDQLRIEALEGIDKVNWSKLHHAYGEASDFPALLLATFSNDEKDREFAIHFLFGTIWHQGTVYEASVYAVPFLLKVLESPDTPDKTIIAILLACLADGHSYLDVHAVSDEKNEKIWREILAKDNRELEAEIARVLEYVYATRKAVGEGLHLLYPYLDDENASADIARVLAFYPECKAEIIPLLERAQASIIDEYAKEEIQITLAKFRQTNGS